MTWGQFGDDRDDVGTTGMMGTTWVETMGTTGTTWGPSEGYGDNVGMTRMMWGRHGDHGDNKITKNAITFEQIKIIEFHLKIWDP